MENHKKINVILGDIDSCLFHNYPQNTDKTPIQDWLIKSNFRLLTLQLLAIRTEVYDRVIIGYGTNRQDFRIDKYNPGGSCAPVLPLLQSYFQQELDCEVLIEPFLMADIYGNKPAGMSYCSILKELYGHKPQQHSRSLLDESKISLLYAHLHRAAMNNPDAQQITLDFFDDSPGILYKLRHFYRKHQQLIPSNTILRLHHYEGGSPKSYGKPIQGTGIIDNFYVWTVRLLAAVTCYSPFENTDEVQIRYASELKDYHNKNRYFEPHRKTKMDVSVPNYDINKLCAFRDNEIPTLGNKEIAMIQNPAYVTAQQLYHSGLIPGELVLHQHYHQGLYESPETVALNHLKTRLSQVFHQYISCWKLSIFGHKHNERATLVLEAILECQKIDEVKMILNNQYNLFTRTEYKSGPIPHLDNRWSRSKLIVNPARENKQSNYLDIITQAQRIVDTMTPVVEDEHLGFALARPEDSDVIIYPH